MFVETAAYFVGRPFHWRIFNAKPFYSSDFWTFCLWMGIVLSISDNLRFKRSAKEIS